MGSESTLEKRLKGALEPLVADQDLYLERLEVLTRGKSRVVRVTLDLASGPGALGSDLLGDVSREISALLDELDLISGVYTLEVTSPGATRPLTLPRHYDRAQGRLLKMRFTDGKTLVARVISATDEAVTVRLEGRNEAVYHYAEIASAAVEIERRRLEEEN